MFKAFADLEIGQRFAQDDEGKIIVWTKISGNRAQPEKRAGGPSYFFHSYVQVEVLGPGQAPQISQPMAIKV